MVHAKMSANIPPPPPPEPSGREAWHRLHSFRHEKFVFPQSLLNEHTFIRMKCRRTRKHTNTYKAKNCKT